MLHLQYRGGFHAGPDRAGTSSMNYLFCVFIFKAQHLLILILY